MMLIALAVGLLFGALINISANSLPSTRTIERPHCHACGAPRRLIAWSGLISALSSNRQCEYCGSRVALREPLVELLTVAGALSLYLSNPLDHRWFLDLITISIFLLILIIDLEHRLILHVVSLPAAAYFGLVGSLNGSLGASRTIIGGLVGFIFFLALYILGALFARWVGRRRGQEIDEVAFGFGDVMLALVIGLSVGFPGVIGALLRGILLAGFFSFMYMLVMAIRKRYEAFTPIPYGPFLIIGAVWIYFRGDPALEALLGY